MTLQSERLSLKTLIPDMVTQKYVDWMNDPDINKYTESRFSKHTMDSVKSYVKDISGSSVDYFYGIFLERNHIGNIKLHINEHHNLGDVGIIIGDKTQWGKGYATEAIKTVTEHGFDKLELNKISAGIYANNTGSRKAFEKAGYEQEAVHKRTYLCGGEYADEIIVSRWNDKK